ncbi:MAG TPA: hypothetical protein VLK58_21365 [Conexibacter sp.]|nr:hypothetical protein [Conexibacter sp.]
MSTREEALLAVDAEPGVEIDVLDSELTVVASGVGCLGERLPVGLYELEFRAGRTRESRVVRLTSDGLRLAAPPIAFAAPALLADARHRELEKAAVDASHAMTERLGDGGELLLVVRDDAPTARANALAGLSLRPLEGRALTRFEHVSAATEAGENPVWAATSAALDPGAYRLRVATGSITVEQTVMIVAGWQTQVFLQRRRWGEQHPRRRASLPDASVLMARIGLGYEPRRDDLRLTELARLALVDRRPALSTRDLEDLVFGKGENPMLGLLGANLLIATGSGDDDLLATMRRNLRGLLGDHPDVAALEAGAGVRESPIAVAPMLGASWDTIVAATTERPSLIAAESPAGRVSDRRFGMGAWLTWTVPRRRQRRLRDDDEVGHLVKAVAQLAANFEEEPGQPELAELSHATQGVMSLAREAARGGGTETEALESFDEKLLVEQLGMPRSVVDVAVGEALAYYR